MLDAIGVRAVQGGPLSDPTPVGAGPENRP